MRHQECEVCTIGDLVSALDAKSGDDFVWYRGQAQASWELSPSLARLGKMEAEDTIIKRFKQSAAPYIQRVPMPGHSGEWEWIFLMQHHRAPTRLLDWTENPLVALYFAINEDAYDEYDGALWCLDPISLNKSAGHTRRYPRDILAFGVDEVVDNYLPEKAAGGRSVLNPVAAIGPRNLPRMVAQAGTFTVIHQQGVPIEQVDDGKHVWKFILPSRCKSRLRYELNLIGVNEFTLFPDLDQVAKLAGALGG